PCLLLQRSPSASPCPQRSRPRSSAGSRRSPRSPALLPEHRPGPATSSLSPYTTLFRSPPMCAWKRSVRLTLCRRSLASEREPHRSVEHTSELQSPDHLVCRLLLEKKKNKSKKE